MQIIFVRRSGIPIKDFKKVKKLRQVHEKVNDGKEYYKINHKKIKDNNNYNIKTNVE